MTTIPTAIRADTATRRGVGSMRVWLLGFLFFTATSLLQFGYRYLDDLARGHQHTFGMRMLEELTGGYTAALLFPFVVLVVRRLRMRRDHWVRPLAGHLLAMLTFAVLHTTLMAVSRIVLAPLFGLGRYDYGVMLYRYPMEAMNQTLVYWVWVMAISLFDHYDRARRRELETAALEARLAEAKLENLRLQLHPHFLFNTINTISSVMYEDVERADSMLARLADLLRLTLHRSGTQEVPLNDELEVIALYIEMMEARFGSSLKMTLEIEPETRRALVPQLILQPLVENAIRHGTNAGGSGADITVCATRAAEQLVLEVSDRGRGLPANAAPQHRGVGTSNTAERLTALYGDAHELSLRNRDGGGATATVRLPFRTSAENAT